MIRDDTTDNGTRVPIMASKQTKQADHHANSDRTDKVESENALSSEEWGKLVASLFRHDVVSSVCTASAEKLATEEEAALLHKELRSFVALKTRLQSGSPEDRALQTAHLKLLELVQKVFMTAHQACENRIMAEQEEATLKGAALKKARSQAGSKRRLTLEWHLMKVAPSRLQFLQTLQEATEKNAPLLQQLDLPDDITKEAKVAGAK
jgi:hypothetical protein